MRFDPEQGQTSVLSIPRDLMVNITTPSGQVYASEKINAAYTIGSRLGGAKGGIVLAAETIKREVFPELKLNGIVDVNFRGFIQVVDTLGCAYVNVDHHYYNENVGTTETDYTSINLQPGYQKLCYENALDYVRYRHTDSDFVRVARQQDFLRDLREQINPANEVGQIDTVAKAVGHAITSTFHASAERADRTDQADRLLAVQAAAPGQVLRAQTSTSRSRRWLLRDDAPPRSSKRRSRTSCTVTNSWTCLPQAARARITPRPPPLQRRKHLRAHTRPVSRRTATGNSEAVKAAVERPLPGPLPDLQTGPAEQQQVRAYTLKDQQGHLHHAYVDRMAAEHDRGLLRLRGHRTG